MFSVFRSPVITNRKNIQQENNVVARKPGQLSSRKPFADRPVNSKQNDYIVKPKQNAPLTTVKPKITPKTVAPVSDEPYLDPSFYVCSYKEVKDTYNDIYDEKLFLGKTGMNNIHQKFLNYNTPVKIPTLENVHTAEFLKIEDDADQEEKDFNADEISYLFKNDFNLNLPDVPFPELDFDF